MEKRKKRNLKTIVLLGSTGAGKSETGNTLAGQPNLFKSSGGMESFTKETCVKKASFFGERKEDIEIIDTPGLGDSNGDDKKNISGMVEELKESVKYLESFLLVLNSAAPKIDSHLKKMIQLFTAIFSDYMWKNTMVVFTHWGYDEESVYKRETNGETAERKSEELNELLRKKFGVEMNVPCVFIDNHYSSAAVKEQASEEELKSNNENLQAIRKFIKKCKPFDCKQIQMQLSQQEQAEEELERVEQDIEERQKGYEFERKKLRKQEKESNAKEQELLELIEKLKEDLELAKDDKRNMEEASEDQKKLLKENEKKLQNAERQRAELEREREETLRQKRDLERQHKNGLGALNNEKNGLVKILKSIGMITKIMGGGRGGGDCAIF